MILEIRDLACHFGGLKAVDGVSFDVKEGTIHSIIGPNGAGKTTLFNLISGATRVAAGTVRFLGRNVTGVSADRLARLGLVRTFQRTSIFTRLTVAENVALAVRSRKGLNTAIRISRAEADAVSGEALVLLGHVGLRRHERAEAGTLAHGSQRALDIAIGLALQPKLILMDEPMSGMSRGDRKSLADQILRLPADLGVTVLLVEHDIGMVMQLSDVITAMQTGRVIAEGSPQEIRNSAAVKSAYLHGSFAA
jgi:branched-chain amino acid transport system ATP-binding protein